MRKARTDVASKRRDERGIWWVTTVKGDTYRVQVYDDGWATCTCRHGLNHAPAKCYHAAAVILGDA